MPETRLDIEYEIFNAKNQLVCTGNTVLVFVDVKTRRPRRAPEFFVNAVRVHFQ